MPRNHPSHSVIDIRNSLLEDNDIEDISDFSSPEKPRYVTPLSPRNRYIIPNNSRALIPGSPSPKKTATGKRHHSQIEKENAVVILVPGSPSPLKPTPNKRIRKAPKPIKRGRRRLIDAFNEIDNNNTESPNAQEPRDRALRTSLPLLSEMAVEVSPLDSESPHQMESASKNSSDKSTSSSPSRDVTPLTYIGIGQSAVISNDIPVLNLSNIRSKPMRNDKWKIDALLRLARKGARVPLAFNHGNTSVFEPPRFKETGELYFWKQSNSFTGTKSVDFLAQHNDTLMVFHHHYVSLSNKNQLDEAALLNHFSNHIKKIKDIHEELLHRAEGFCNSKQQDTFNGQMPFKDVSVQLIIKLNVGNIGCALQAWVGACRKANIAIIPPRFVTPNISLSCQIPVKSLKVINNSQKEKEQKQKNKECRKKITHFFSTPKDRDSNSDRSSVALIR